MCFNIFVMMLKNILYLFIFFSGFNLTIQSQYNMDIGFSFGASGYLGDIGGLESTAQKFLGDLTINQSTPCAGVFLRRKISSRISFNTGLNYIRVSGDDAKTLEGPRNWRNLRFQNNIFELTAKGEFTLIQISDLGGKGRYNTHLDLFAHMGFTIFTHSPKGSKNGYSWTKLRPLKTEGFTYKKICFGSPIGGGVIITHNRYTRFGLVLNYTQTFTDYLDDVSNVFIDPAELSSEAVELANQFNGPEENSIYFSSGQPRGNPSNFDVYMNLSFTYSRYFTGRNRYMRSNSWRSRSYYKPKSFQKAKSRHIRSKF